MHPRLAKPNPNAAARRRVLGQTSDGWVRLIAHARRERGAPSSLTPAQRSAIDVLLAANPQTSRVPGAQPVSSDTLMIEVAPELSAHAIRVLTRGVGLSVTSVTALLSASNHKKPHRPEADLLDAPALADEIRFGELSDRVSAAMRLRDLSAAMRDRLSPAERDALAAAVAELAATALQIFDAAVDSERVRANEARSDLSTSSTAGLRGIGEVVWRVAEAISRLEAPSTRDLLERTLPRSRVATLYLIAS